ncbi:MAG: TetR/AcrR family transcriptional regulator [Fibrella sp.]|nr:TetR/AcrR family transcriptional regulator [Armatimonadota bacterium]
MSGKNITGCESLGEPVDPRVRRTRNLLRDALRSLMREKRFSSISVQEIAARATVNRATFYAHYTDKEELARSALTTDLRKALMSRFTEKPPLTHENLLELALGVFDFVGSMNDACPETTAELQETVGTAVQQGIYEVLEMWLADGAGYARLFPGSRRETVATVLSWSLYGGAHRWSRSQPRTPALRVCQEIISMLLPQSDGAMRMMPPPK